MLYLESINESLHDLMKNNDDVILIGEDLLDPYGGAFKVSRGLSTQFPKQVISTPISEQAITGAAIGMAMRGMKPIVEIMFGDFLTLCVDQIVNHATKYHWMFNEQVNVPIVIRTPMGGGRGYGPTHSQSLESMFMSVSGLDIYTPSIFHDPGKMLKYCVMDNSHPIIFIENKSAYPKNIITGSSYDKFKIFRSSAQSKVENILLTLYPNEKADVVIITYGGMSELALKCAYELFIEEEIMINVFILGSIKPIAKNDVVDQAKICGRILILEEGHQIGGWGAEVSSIVQEGAFASLHAPVVRVGAADSPIPSAIPMENEVLPSLKLLKKSILNLVKII
jgi:pyruvate/2-oxoglutarate/acetoin dehydrogenase E1 component